MFFSRTVRKHKVVFTESQFQNPQITVGRYTYGLPRIYSVNWPCAVKIGSFCSIADHVQIFMDVNHRLDWVTTFPFPALSEFSEADHIYGHPWARGDVQIGNDVWIGNDVSILSGVTIGDGAVIGTGAMVTKDIPSYAVAVGNPAKVIKLRFTETQIAQLLKIRWWDWPIEKIRAYIPLLCGDIEIFLQKITETECLAEILSQD
ncbi:CatB-related O-acetyltransferase [Anaerosinus massiliensis]|uniref:CatB-related O-acetyltransferase n=1 Tax=Massilibacillus massiliensis TaxID=1806837 RepID=UPI000DA62914|nr:CatB-related O-acetyltransferase [Massilibacillus massiliensis]